MTFWAAIQSLGAAVIGAGAALAARYLADRNTASHQRRELALREMQFWAQFVLPVATRRAEALEEIHDLVQKAVEESKLSMSDYERIRRLILYLIPPHQARLLTALRALIEATRKADRAAVSDATLQLKQAQLEIRSAMGLDTVEEYVSLLQAAKGDIGDLTTRNARRPPS